MHILCLLATFRLVLLTDWASPNFPGGYGGDSQGCVDLSIRDSPESAQSAGPPGQPAAQRCSYPTPLSGRDSAHSSRSSRTCALGCMSTPLTACNQGMVRRQEGEARQGSEQQT